MIGPRTQSRRYAALALYQWALTGEPVSSIKRQLLDDPEWLDVIAGSLHGVEDEDAPNPELRFQHHPELLDQILSGVPANLEAIDRELSRCVDRPLSQVDPVELAILRLGAFEILFSNSVPNPVAINEAVELAKLLGSYEGHRYVNAVLDKIARAQPPVPPRQSGASRETP